VSTVFQVAATGAAATAAGGGRTLPLRRADNTSDAEHDVEAYRRPTDPQKRLRCLPPPPPPPRGFYWLQHQHQHQQLMQNDSHQHHPSSSSTSPGADSDRPVTSYVSATLPARDSRTVSRDHRRHFGRAVTSSGGHSSADDVADSTPRVYQISPGAVSVSSTLKPTHEVVV